jgi:hypothetical protein
MDQLPYFELLISTFGPRHIMKTPKAQCMIAYEDCPRYEQGGLVGSDFYGVRFAFELKKCWGSDGIPRARDDIARQKWCETDPKIALEAGVWEVLAIFRVIHPPGKVSYMYVGFDRSFFPCVVRKKWDYHLYFDDVVKAGRASEELSHVLSAFDFDDSIKRGTSEEQLVIQLGKNYELTQPPNSIVIPGLQLKYTSSKEGARFEFRTVVQQKSAAAGRSLLRLKREGLDRG